MRERRRRGRSGGERERERCHERGRSDFSLLRKEERRGSPHALLATETISVARRCKKREKERERVMGMLQLSGSYGRVDVLLSFRRVLYFLFLFQVVAKKSGAYDEESKNGGDADTSRALRTACTGRWKCLHLSPLLIGWVFFIYSPNLFDEMDDVERSGNSFRE